MADFQSHLSEFESIGASVYALSTDDLEHAKETVEKNGVTFPVLYGVDGPKLAQTWGSYYEERRNILHATNFVLRPDHTIGVASYSTAQIGRIVAVDAINAIKFYQKQAAEAAQKSGT